MATLEETQRILQEAETAQRPYEDPNLSTQIRQQVMNQWQPTLEGATNNMAKQRGEYLGKFWGTPGEFGNTAADLSPTQQASIMGNRLGEMTGMLQGSQNVADYLGGQANTLAQRAIEAAMLGRQSAADKYSRAFQNYQLAYQADEARKQREFQAAEANRARAAARSSGGGGINFPSMSSITGAGTQSLDPTMKKFRDVYGAYIKQGNWEAAANTLERWGAYVAPNWEGLVQTPYKDMFEKMWADVQYNRTRMQSDRSAANRANLGAAKDIFKSFY